MVARDESLLARTDIEDEVVIALSGRAADVTVGEGANAGAGGTGHAATSSDLAVATRLLTAVHASFGLGLTLRHRGSVAIGGLQDTNGEVAALVEADLQRLMLVAEQAVAARANEVRALAQALIDRGFLTKTDVGAVVSAVRIRAGRRGHGTGGCLDRMISGDHGRPVRARNRRIRRLTA